MNALLLTLRNQGRRGVDAARTSGPLIGAEARVAAGLLIGLWLAVVIYSSMHHVYWRDEVRALSLAREARTPVDLVARIRNEGHPGLWYLLLYCGQFITSSPLVLPAISISAALAAVAIFLFEAPFPLWFRALFIFGVLPVHEYSVMARNYGISMLLLFIAAALYRARPGRPLIFAFVLALLANTNVHSALFVLLLAAAWTWDFLREQHAGSSAANVRSLAQLWVPVGAGLLLSAAVAWPDAKSSVVPIYRANSTSIDASIFAALLRPAYVFSTLSSDRLPELAGNLLFYLALFGLIRRPNLFFAALLAQFGLGLFFIDVYPGWLRHQGLFLIFLITLYWIDRDAPVAGDTSRGIRLLSMCGLYFAMVTLLLCQLGMARRAVWNELHTPRSSSRAFGEWLHSSAFTDAILVPEPAYLIESLPYYAQNPIYFPRESRFGTTSSFTRDAAPVLTLGQMLATGRELKQKSRQPVLLVLPIWRMRREYAVKRPNFNQSFIWTAADVDELHRSTRLVAEFNSAADENYHVYEVR